MKISSVVLWALAAFSASASACGLSGSSKKQNPEVNNNVPNPVQSANADVKEKEKNDGSGNVPSPGSSSTSSKKETVDDKLDAESAQSTATDASSAAHGNPTQVKPAESSPGDDEIQFEKVYEQHREHQDSLTDAHFSFLESKRCSIDTKSTISNFHENFIATITEYNTAVDEKKPDAELQQLKNNLAKKINALFKFYDIKFGKLNEAQAKLQNALEKAKEVNAKAVKLLDSNKNKCVKSAVSLNVLIEQLENLIKTSDNLIVEIGKLSEQIKQQLEQLQVCKKNLEALKSDCEKSTFSKLDSSELANSFRNWSS